MIRIKWIAVLLVLLAMGCAKEESTVVENLDFDTLTAEFDTFTAGFADASVFSAHWGARGYGNSLRCVRE